MSRPDLLAQNENTTAHPEYFSPALHVVFPQGACLPPKTVAGISVLSNFSCFSILQYVLRSLWKVVPPVHPITAHPAVFHGLTMRRTLCRISHSPRSMSDTNIRRASRGGRIPRRPRAHGLQPTIRFIQQNMGKNRLYLQATQAIAAEQ